MDIAAKQKGSCPSGTKIAWCSDKSNLIKAYDSSSSKETSPIKGVLLGQEPIPHSNYVFSFDYENNYTASFAIYDCIRPRKIYSYTAVKSANPAPGSENLCGGSACNSISGLAAILPLKHDSYYYLFDFRKLQMVKKRVWQSTYGGHICSLDFNPTGTKIVSIDERGKCLVSTVGSGILEINLRVKNAGLYNGQFNRCKWNPLQDSPLVACKFDFVRMNLLDVEKQTFLYHDFVYAERYGWSMWIDWRFDGNLLACAGYGDVHIFDRRANEVVRSLKNLHIDFVRSVRWNAAGSLLVTAGADSKVKLVDFKSEKIHFVGSTPDGKPASSACFLGE